MHRAPLLAALDAYSRRHPHEAPVAGRIAALVRAHADCFLRTNLPGHVTASSWILSTDRSAGLLTLHRKLGRWLQLGGHSDGEGSCHLVALREAREESGLERLAFVAPDGSLLGDDAVPEPFDLDVHVIPARGDEPEHEHHDVRFLLVAGEDQELHVSDESHDLRWFTDEEVPGVQTDESVLRLLRKARAIVGPAGVPLPATCVPLADRGSPS